MSKFIELKILIVGDPNIGKTQFSQNYAYINFNEIYKPTLVSEFSFKIVVKNEKPYRFQIWDISCNDNTRKITKIFVKDSHGFIVMCDATKKLTRER